MRLVVISPETADSREVPAMEGFFAAGLERYHVRKPAWTRNALEAWLGHLPAAWRPRIILHGHPALAAALGLGGAHEADGAAGGGPPAFSRSCHDVPTLRRLLPAHGSLFFGPVFPSLSKPGYGPAPDFPWAELSAALAGRSRGDARVLAIGGVTAAGLPRCRDLGFDGAAVLGAVWGEADPVAAYAALRGAAGRLEAERNAA
jgi:thiamine-phosphate pyrophosphorylase